MPAVHYPHRVLTSMGPQTYTLTFDIAQRIVFHVESLQGPVPPDGTTTAPLRSYIHDGDGTLKSLRLVNKNFHRAATPLVFKSIAFFPAIRTQRIDMQTLMCIVNSDIAAYVKTLIIRPMLSNSVDDQWFQCSQFAHALPICFSKFSNLNTIRVDGGIFLKFDRPMKYGNTLSLLSSLRRSFVKALHSALMQTGVHGLKGLELDFPVLDGFFQMFSGYEYLDQISGVLSRLEQLTVAVQSQHVHACITSSSAVTAHQLYFSDVQYQGRLWTLIGLAANLRYLKIHCPTVLDLDNIKLSSLQKLEELDLARVRCRTGTLLALCSPGRASLKSLRLSEVRLITGLWADVFHRLKEIPSLTVFDPKSLTYDSPSPHFAKILHPFDPYLEIPRRDDRDAFQELVKAVNTRKRMSAYAACNGPWMQQANSLPN